MAKEKKSPQNSEEEISPDNVLN
ncbi:uncharacterized protein G2W53_006117 [Senna tora]|uniref:Uncharacterized protein n=1 Tax=Senna tora TaxID=362788 RepID=A0A834X412_9FABA|nr:uncharacterized protein G2W53_006117 [Senna tora]